MARRGFFREIILRLDRRSAEQVRSDIQDALDAAGKSGADALEEAMQQGGQKAAWTLRRILSEAYEQTIAEARVKLAKGLIDQREFARIRAQAAETFDRGLIAGMERLRQEGNLTERQFRALARSLKTVGREGEQDVGRLGRALEKLRGWALSAGAAIAGIFAFRTVKRFLDSAEELSRQAQISAQRLEAMWRANAGAARLSLEEINAFVARMKWSTLFGQEEIELAIAQLLSYKSIAGETFTDTIELAADMASVFGGLERSTMALARALDDPVRGLGDLRRAGFTFEESVIAQVKSLVEQNRLLDAQRILIRELQKEVSGVAAGMKRGWAAIRDDAKKAWDDIKIAIGDALTAMDGASSGADRLVEALQAMERWIRANSSQISTLTGRLLDAAAAVAEWAQTFMDVLDPAGQVARIRMAGLMRLGLDAEGWRRVALDLGKEISQLTEQQARLEQELAQLEAGPRVFARGAPVMQRDVQRRMRQIREQLDDIRNQIVGLERVQAMALERSRAQLQTTQQTANTASGLRETEEERLKRISEEVGALRRGYDLRVLTREELARALELEREVSRALTDGTRSLEDRITLAQQLQALQEITPQIGPPQLADTMGALPALAPIPLEPIRDARAEIDALAEAWLEANADMVGAVERAAMGITGAFQDAFSILFEDFDNVGEAAEAMARSVAGALVGGVADYASSKVSENVALAIEATARALAAASNPFTAGLAPGFWAAAKTHALAAAKWAVLAGAAGAGQAAIAGGGRGGLSGGIPTGARDPSGRLFEATRAPEIHIYIDPLDPYRPAWQEAVYAANRMATERFGSGATVHVHPMGGRR